MKKVFLFLIVGLLFCNFVYANNRDKGKGHKYGHSKNQTTDKSVINTSTVVNTVNTTNTVINAKEEIKKDNTDGVLIAEARIYDGRYVSISPFMNYNVEKNNMDIVGIRVNVKFGKSYEERRIEEEVNKRLKEIERKIKLKN